MFSWIVENKAKIIGINSGRFTVENIFSHELKVGQSIAHDWACMTVEKFNKETYTFFAMEETLKKTNFWKKKTWDNFNLERCLIVWDRLDGHFVTGHIDTVWKINNIEVMQDSSVVMQISFDEEFSKLLVYKWSITVNWVSLTIISNSNTYFEISLISHTLKITNLWDLKIWDYVNLEFDILGKYILNK
jgi:riboflavin synthase